MIKEAIKNVMAIMTGKKKCTKAIEKMTKMAEAQQFDELEKFILSKESDPAFQFMHTIDNRVNTWWALIDKMTDGKCLLLLAKKIDLLTGTEEKYLPLSIIASFMVITDRIDLIEKLHVNCPYMFINGEDKISYLYNQKNKIMLYACAHGSIDIVRFIDNLDKENPFDYKFNNNEIYRKVCMNGHYEIIDFLVNEKNLYSFEEIQKIEVTTKNNNILQIPKEYILNLIKTRDEALGLKKTIFTNPKPANQKRVI